MFITIVPVHHCLCISIFVGLKDIRLPTKLEGRGGGGAVNFFQRIILVKIGGSLQG